MKLPALVAAALFVSQMAAADEAACKIALDAVTRVLATPNHQYMTRTDPAGGTPRRSEIIDTGIAMYVEVGGKWRTSPLSPQGMQDMLIENQKKAKATSCRLLREESIDGKRAAVYSVHNETDAGLSDSTLWISSSDGLPLRQEIDMDVSGGKSHSEVRFVYTDVKAPPNLE